MLFFLQHGYRVIAHDRRGHGRSTQTSDGHDMDHYADDLAALTAHLDLQDAVHVGHSTGGGEVARYIARHGESRVAKAVLISSVPPLMVQTDANPGGLPKSVFDGLQAELAANRSVFYRALPSGPFYGFNRPGVEPSEAIIENWWRQGMMGGAKAHYDGIVAFSQTDFTEDLKKITVPVLVMHGDDDQIVPYADSGPLSAALVQNGTLKTLQRIPARHADHPGRQRSTPTCWPSCSPDRLVTRRIVADFAPSLRVGQRTAPLVGVADARSPLGSERDDPCNRDCRVGRIASARLDAGRAPVFDCGRREAAVSDCRFAPPHRPPSERPHNSRPRRISLLLFDGRCESGSPSAAIHRTCGSSEAAPWPSLLLLANLTTEPRPPASSASLLARYVARRA